MSEHRTVHCTVTGFLGKRTQDIVFDIGNDIAVGVHGEPLGPHGITETGADLIDLAMAIYQIERSLSGFRGGNRPVQYNLSIKLRRPELWQGKAIEKIRELLYLQGNAIWNINILSSSMAPVPPHKKHESGMNEISQITLFSGGLDSTCGLATLLNSSKITQPVSFYSRQKKLQIDITRELGFTTPVQFSRKTRMNPGSGRRSYYRSFLFLSLAAVAAFSWDVRKILQFENGVLATAVPPGDAWFMTRHAHPILHKLCEELFDTLFGGEWIIENPALFMTKRELYLEACDTLGQTKAQELAQKTETCWFFNSPTIPGGTKNNNQSCGVCIPCIIRRTALRDDQYAIDLCGDKDKRNDKRLGLNFRSYYGLASDILRTRNNPYEFYTILPDITRQLIAPIGKLRLDDLQNLFIRFSHEFIETFDS